MQRRKKRKERRFGRNKQFSDGCRQNAEIFSMLDTVQGAMNLIFHFSAFGNKVLLNCLLSCKELYNRILNDIDFRAHIRNIWGFSVKNIKRSSDNTQSFPQYSIYPYYGSGEIPAVRVGNGSALLNIIGHSYQTSVKSGAQIPLVGISDFHTVRRSNQYHCFRVDLLLRVPSHNQVLCPIPLLFERSFWIPGGDKNFNQLDLGNVSRLSDKLARLHRTRLEDYVRFRKERFSKRLDKILERDYVKLLLKSVGYSLSHIDEFLRRVDIEILQRYIKNRKKVYFFGCDCFAAVYQEWIKESVAESNTSSLYEEEEKSVQSTGEEKSVQSTGEEKLGHGTNVKKYLDVSHLDIADLPINFNSEQKMERKKQVRHLKYHFERDVTTFFEPNLNALTKLQNDIPLDLVLSSPLAPQFQLKVSSENGEISSKSFTDESKKPQKMSLMEEFIQHVQGLCPISALKMKLEANNRSGDWKRISKWISDGKKRTYPNLYLLRFPYGRQDQIGLIKHILHLVEEIHSCPKFHLAFIKAQLEYFHYLLIQEKSKIFLPKSYKGQRVSLQKSGNHAVLNMEVIGFQMQDESTMIRDNRIKFLLGYFSYMVQSNPMTATCLEPFVYLEQALDFFKNRNVFGSGKSQMIEILEKTPIKRDLFNMKIGKVSIQDEVLRTIDLYGDFDCSGVSRLQTVHFVSMKEIDDLCEFCSQFLCFNHPVSDIDNYNRGVGFLTAPPATADSDILPLKYVVTKRQIFDSIRNGKFDQIRFHYALKEQLNGIVRNRTWSHIVFDYLHASHAEDSVFRKTIVENFILYVIYKAGACGSCEYQCGWVNEALLLLNLMESNGMLKKAFKLEFGGIVFVDNQMAWFDQKKNSTFYELLGNPMNVIPAKVLSYIQQINDADERSFLESYFNELVSLCQDVSSQQRSYYRNQYFTEVIEYENQIAIEDRIDYRFDSLSCHVQRCMKHYRDFKNILHVPFLILTIGKLIFGNLQHMEGSHATYKRRQFISHSWSAEHYNDVELKVMNSKSTAVVCPNLYSNMSRFFFYQKLHYNGVYNFLEDSVEYEIDPDDELTLKHDEVVKRIMKNPAHSEWLSKIVECEENVMDEDEDEIIDKDAMDENEDEETEGGGEGDVASVGDDSHRVDKYGEFIDQKHNDRYHEELESKRTTFNLLTKRFSAMLAKVNFYAKVNNFLKLEVVDGEFESEDLSKIEPILREILLEEQEQFEALTEIFKHFRSYNNVLLGAEMGFGKTAVMAAFLLLLYLNVGICNHFVFMSRGDLCDNFVSMVEKFCSHFGCKVPILYDLASVSGTSSVEAREKRKKFLGKFSGTGGILLTTMESATKLCDLMNFPDIISKFPSFISGEDSDVMEDSDLDDVDEMESNDDYLKRIVILVDESHIVKNKKLVESLIPFFKLCFFRIFASGSFYNGDLVSCTNQMSLFQAEHVERFSSLEDMRSFILKHLVRKHTKLPNFEKKFYIIKLSFSEKIDKFFDRYLHLYNIKMKKNYDERWANYLENCKKLGKKPRPQKPFVPYVRKGDAQRKWLPAGVAFRVINETCDAIDLFFQRWNRENYGEDVTELRSQFPELFDEEGEFSFMNLEDNRKLKFAQAVVQAAQEKCRDSKQPVGIVLFVRTKSFFEYLMRSLTALSWFHAISVEFHGIHGGYLSDLRTAIVKQWSSVKSGVSVLISTVKVGMTGLNLQFAPWVVMLNHPSDVEENIQPPWRVIRPFQKWPETTCTQVLMHNSFEDHHYEKFSLDHILAHHYIMDGIKMNRETLIRQFDIDDISAPSKNDLLRSVYEKCSKIIHSINDFSHIMFPKRE